MNRFADISDFGRCELNATFREAAFTDLTIIVNPNVVFIDVKTDFRRLRKRVCGNRCLVAAS